jgi:hypothetical protein
MGALGAEQLDWLERDVKRLKNSTPIVVFAHIPLWSVYPEWGWGTDDSARALSYLKRFGSVSVLNGHIHQVMKVEGNVTFHTAMSTAFVQPAPGAAPSPGPMKVEGGRLKQMLGSRRSPTTTSITRLPSPTCRSRTPGVGRSRRAPDRPGQLQLLASRCKRAGRRDGDLDESRRRAAHDRQHREKVRLARAGHRPAVLASL